MTDHVDWVKIRITLGLRERLKKLGDKGDTYHDIVEQLVQDTERVNIVVGKR